MKEERGKREERMKDAQAKGTQAKGTQAKGTQAKGTQAKDAQVEGMRVKGERSKKWIFGPLLNMIAFKRIEKLKADERKTGYRPKFSCTKDRAAHLEEAVQRVQAGNLVALVREDGTIWKEGVVFPFRFDQSAGTFTFAWMDKDEHMRLGQGPIDSVLTPTLAKRLAEIQRD